jgi:hypothetical protein
MTTRTRALLLLAASAFLASCESGVGAVRPAPGVEVVDGADPATVDLMTEPPARPFRLVGRVRASADARFEGRIDEARAAAERELREQGARVGADAVILDEAFVLDLDGAAIEDPVPVLEDERNRQRPGGAAYATRPVHRVVLVGRAIRWAPAPPPE